MGRQPFGGPGGVPIRIVVLLLALAGVFAALPVHAEEVAAAGLPDECVVNPSAGIACQKIDDPNVGSPVPAAGTHYVWLGPGQCLQGLTVDIPDCRGTPAGDDSTAGVFGIVYEESNKAGGLQRHGNWLGDVFYGADAMLLI